VDVLPDSKDLPAFSFLPLPGVPSVANAPMVVAANNTTMAILLSDNCDIE
jgi:hypothetical protein